MGIHITSRYDKLAMNTYLLYISLICLGMFIPLGLFSGAGLPCQILHIFYSDGLLLGSKWSAVPFLGTGLEADVFVCLGRTISLKCFHYCKRKRSTHLQSSP